MSSTDLTTSKAKQRLKKTFDGYLPTEKQLTKAKEALKYLYESDVSIPENKRYKYAYMFADHNHSEMLADLPYNLSLLPKIEDEIMLFEQHGNLQKMWELESTLESLIVFYSNVPFMRWYLDRVKCMLLELYLFIFLHPNSKTIEGDVYDKIEALLTHNPPSRGNVLCGWGWTVLAAVGMQYKDRMEYTRCLGKAHEEFNNTQGIMPKWDIALYRVLSYHYCSIFNGYTVSNKSMKMLLGVVRMDINIQSIQRDFNNTTISLRAFSVWLKKTFVFTVTNACTILLSTDESLFESHPTFESSLEVIMRETDEEDSE